MTGIDPLNPGQLGMTTGALVIKPCCLFSTKDQEKMLDRFQVRRPVVVGQLAEQSTNNPMFKGSQLPL